MQPEKATRVTLTKDFFFICRN